MMGEMVEVVALPGMEELAAENPYDEAQRCSVQARRLFELSEGGGDFPGMDMYWDLVARGWEWRKAVYILWLAMPGGQRMPPTQQELATKVLGLASDRRLRVWREENPAIQTELERVVRETFFWAVPDVNAALIDSASRPGGRHSGSDRRLFYEMIGYAVREGGKLPEDLTEVSSAELLQIADSVGEGGRSSFDTPSETRATQDDRDE